MTFKTARNRAETRSRAETRERADTRDNNLGQTGIFSEDNNILNKTDT